MSVPSMISILKINTNVIDFFSQTFSAQKEIKTNHSVMVPVISQKQ